MWGGGGWVTFSPVGVVPGKVGSLRSDGTAVDSALSQPSWAAQACDGFYWGAS